MLALTAGILIFCAFFCGFCGGLPKNVYINGIAVGGMNREEAARIIREDYAKKLREKELKIYGKSAIYTFKYPEINFKDNLKNVLKSIKKGGKYEADFKCYLCGLNEIAPDICRNESVFAVEPYAVFNSFGEPFSYFSGNDGFVADEGKLKEDILSSINSDFEKVTLKFTEVKRTKTVEEVKNDTALLAAFTTYYDGGNLTRASNIRLAAAKLNGCILEGGQTLSFNQTVGARVKERGFLPAKIIVNGEYTEGVGGGVCQVSTTLYNAALLAGLKVSEYHPHSLAVGYVPPSRDAMVSGSSCDLKIMNATRSPVYVRAQTGNGFVSFKIYGRSDGASYSLSSEVTGNIPAPEEDTDDREKAREGKDGITSNGYLTVERGGEKKIVLLRKDKYAPVKKFNFVGGEPEDEEEN